MPGKRLVGQLFLFYCILLSAGLLALGWLASRKLEETYIAGLGEKLETAARILADRSAPLLAAGSTTELEHVVAEVGRSMAVRVTLISADGQVLADTRADAARMGNHADRPDVAAALAGTGDGGVHNALAGGERILLVTLPARHDGNIVGAARVSANNSDIDQELSAKRGSIIGAVLAIGAASAVAGWFVARRIVRPIVELGRGARRLVSGRLTEKLPIADIDELAALAESLNQLASQLEERSHAIGRKGHEQEAVLASMAEGVLAVDSDERVISLNRSAADFIGGKLTEMRGRTLSEVVRNLELRRFASRALASNQPLQDDIVLHGERDKILHIRGTALRDSAGQSVGAVIVFNDVTDMHRLERIRRDFVANVSHELKTPIATIKGFVETLLDGAMENPDDALRFLTIIAGQAERLNSIIEDLLSLSKIERSEEAADLERDPARLRGVLEAAVGDCYSKATERNIEVRLSCDEQIQATINAALLEQAVVNLLDNAIKYSDSGGAVSIVAEQSPNEVTIAVSDRGCGVEQEHLPRLFERFYRVDRARSRKLGGTGLGLAIVKHIVRAHHGQITVASAYGEGSTFTIHLPVLAPAGKQPAGE